MDCDLLIIGAGISALAAARRIHESSPSLRLRILEKSRGVGGRMSTRRFGPEGRQALADLGAQFTYGRGAEWQSLLPSLAEKIPDSSGFHPRYLHSQGMSRIARALLPEGIAIDLQTRVQRLAFDQAQKGFLATFERATPPRELDSAAQSSTQGQLSARAVLLTAPLPQARDLLETSGLASARSLPGLPEVPYSPCLALIARLESESGLAPPGLLEEPSTELSGLFDQRLKGLKSQAQILVAHASPDWSRRNWDLPADEAARALWELARTHLPAQPQALELTLHRWKYSRPEGPRPASPARAFYSAHEAGSSLPLWLCGDAFRMGGVDGAFESGTLAADDILRFLERHSK